MQRAQEFGSLLFAGNSLSFFSFLGFNWFNFIVTLFLLLFIAFFLLLTVVKYYEVEAQVWV